MSRTTTQRFHCFDLPHLGRGAQLVLLPQTTQTLQATATARTGGSHPCHHASLPTQLWLPSHPCTAITSGHPMQSQDGLSMPQTQSLVGLASSMHRTVWTSARRQGRRTSIQPALGLRHHLTQALERSKTPAGRHHRLRRSDDPGLEVAIALEHTGYRRTASRSLVPAFCPSTTTGRRLGVPNRQWPGVHLRFPATTLKKTGIDGLPHSLPQSPIQWSCRILLWQPQTRLSRPSALRNFNPSLPTRSRLDYSLQHSRSAQRSGYARPSHFLSTTLDSITHKNYNLLCPILTGSHHSRNINSSASTITIKKIPAVRWMKLKTQKTRFV